MYISEWVCAPKFFIRNNQKYVNILKVAYQNADIK